MAESIVVEVFDDALFCTNWPVCASLNTLIPSTAEEDLILRSKDFSHF